MIADNKLRMSYPNSLTGLQCDQKKSNGDKVK